MSRAVLVDPAGQGVHPDPEPVPPATGLAVPAGPFDDESGPPAAVVPGELLADAEPDGRTVPGARAPPAGIPVAHPASTIAATSQTATGTGPGHRAVLVARVAAHTFTPPSSRAGPAMTPLSKQIAASWTPGRHLRFRSGPISAQQRLDAERRPAPDAGQR